MFAYLIKFIYGSACEDADWQISSALSGLYQKNIIRNKYHIVKNNNVYLVYVVSSLEQVELRILITQQIGGKSEDLLEIRMELLGNLIFIGQEDEECYYQNLKD